MGAFPPTPFLPTAALAFASGIAIFAACGWRVRKQLRRPVATTAVTFAGRSYLSRKCA